YLPVSGNSFVVMNSDGTDGQTFVPPAVGPFRTAPGSLTSDGSRVLYACMAPESTRFDSLCVIGTDGNGFHQIVIGTDLRDGTLSGDGTTIAYSADGGERTIIDETFRVVRGGAGLSLTHDGSVLCYWASTSFFTVDIFCVNTDGTN